MQGRKPKEREQYVVRINGKILVEVTREVYLAWYQSKRQEKYQRERDEKNGVCSLEELLEKGDFQQIQICEEENSEIKSNFQQTQICEEENSEIKSNFQQTHIKKLNESLESLSEKDFSLIKLLFFSEIAVKDVAEIYGCTPRTIVNRKNRILNELHQKMEE
jgi:RNA polymerase sigma factor (sigma-70 family)